MFNRQYTYGDFIKSEEKIATNILAKISGGHMYKTTRISRIVTKEGYPIKFVQIREIRVPIKLYYLCLDYSHFNCF